MNADVVLSMDEYRRLDHEDGIACTVTVPASISSSWSDKNALSEILYL